MHRNVVRAELHADARSDRACRPRHVVDELVVAFIHRNGEGARIRRRRLVVNLQLVASLDAGRHDRLLAGGVHATVGIAVTVSVTVAITVAVAVTTVAWWQWEGPSTVA